MSMSLFPIQRGELSAVSSHTMKRDLGCTPIAGYSPSQFRRSEHLTDTWNDLDLTWLGIFTSPDCPQGSGSCIQMYLTQAIRDLPGSPLPGSLPDQNQSTEEPSYFKVLQAPINHVYLTKIPGEFVFEVDTSCRFYGYSAYRLIICAREIESEKNKTSLLVGAFG